MKCIGKALRFTLLPVSAIWRRMKRTELKPNELMRRKGMRRVLHGPALHLFAVTRKHTKTLGAETDPGTLR